MGLFSSIGKIAGGFFGGGIGSAIGGIAGGLLDGKKERDAQKDAERRAKAASDGRFAQLRADALAGGYNPLTALENGGMQGAYMPPTSAAPLASIDAITGSIKELGMELSGEAANERARDELEMDLARIKLDQARADIAKGGALRMPGNGYTGNVEIRPSRMSGGMKIDRATSRQGVEIAGGEITPNVGWSNAEDVETRYGEFGGSLYGIGVAAADAGKTLRKWWDEISPNIEIHAPKPLNPAHDNYTARTGGWLSN